MNFQILPAIDLIGGHCVRLYKGSYDQVTQYSKAPQNQAKIFEREGADTLHIVDLDGAKSGNLENLKAIEKIRQHVAIPIEVGGGIRSLESAETLFGIGVDRIIIGTAAVEDTALLATLLEKYGAEKIIVGLDARESGTKIAIHGWKGKTELNTLDFAEDLEQQGITRVIFTDIARDGTLTFPNFDLNERLVNTTKLKIIASGGVSEIEHIKMLHKIGCEGVIIGKALYESELSVASIKQALS